MSRFIRDIDDGGSEELTADDMFQMAEYCQVFLTARYIKDGTDHEFIPLIQRGRLDRMPKEVVEEMDEMFTLAVKELEKWGDNPSGFLKKLEDGVGDPISEYIDRPEMRNALGNVIMRKLRVTRDCTMKTKPLKKLRSFFLLFVTLCTACAKQRHASYGKPRRRGC